MIHVIGVLKTKGPEFRVAEVKAESVYDLKKSGLVYTLFDQVDFIFKDQAKAHQYALNLGKEKDLSIMHVDWFAESLYDVYLKLNDETWFDEMAIYQRDKGT